MKRLVSCVVALVFLAAPVFASAAEKSKVDPNKVRHELREILSAREYDPIKTNAVDRFLASVGKAISDGFSKLGKWLLSLLQFEGSSFGEILATVGAWLVVAAFLLLLGMVAKKLIDNHVRRPKSDLTDDAADYNMPSAKPLIRQAAALAEKGDYRAAFRAAYVACIACLDEMRALRFERSRTNWEYLRELKQGGHEAPYGELHPLTLDFDRKIYGREDCREEDYQNAAAAYSRLSSEEAK